MSTTLHEKDRVSFRGLRDPLSEDTATTELTGTITRVWPKPVTDPYVTIETDGDHRTFVRCSSNVTVIPEETS